MKAIYGDLAKTKAVENLEAYLFECSLREPGVGLFERLADILIEAAPYSYDNSDFTLSIFLDARKEMDAKFFSDFAKAIERRKDPAYRDRFLVLDYIRKKLKNLVFQGCPDLTYDELWALGLTNAYATAGELGLRPFIKKHTDRQGKHKKKNKK